MYYIVGAIVSLVNIYVIHLIKEFGEKYKELENRQREAELSFIIKTGELHETISLLERVCEQNCIIKNEKENNKNTENKNDN